MAAGSASLDRLHPARAACQRPRAGPRYALTRGTTTRSGGSAHRHAAVFRRYQGVSPVPWGVPGTTPQRSPRYHAARDRPLLDTARGGGTRTPAPGGLAHRRRAARARRLLSLHYSSARAPGAGLHRPTTACGARVEVLHHPAARVPSGAVPDFLEPSWGFHSHHISGWLTRRAAAGVGGVLEVHHPDCHPGCWGVLGGAGPLGWSGRQRPAAPGQHQPGQQAAAAGRGRRSHWSEHTPELAVRGRGAPTSIAAPHRPAPPRSVHASGPVVAGAAGQRHVRADQCSDGWGHGPGAGSSPRGST